MLHSPDESWRLPAAVACPMRLSEKARSTRRELPDFRKEERLDRLVPAENASARRRLPELGPWLEDVYRLCAGGKVDPALRLVFDEMDELLHARDTARCDEILGAADVGKLSIDVMLAFLMSSFRARSALRRRAGFLDRVEHRLQAEVPERVDRLLRGLR